MDSTFTSNTTYYIKKQSLSLPVKITAEDTDFIPVYKTEGAACLDCKADILSLDKTRPYLVEDTLTIPPGNIEVIDLGFRVQVPKGYVMNLYIRSGLAAKKGLIMVNGTGKIDSDYRGIVKAIIGNVSQKYAQIKHKDRIVQCEIVPVYTVDFQQVSSLEETDRGEGGLGSTGVNG